MLDMKVLLVWILESNKDKMDVPYAVYHLMLNQGLILPGASDADAVKALIKEIPNI